MVFMRTTDNYYQKTFISDKKMGGIFSRNEPKIQIFECMPLGHVFHYLRPQGTTTSSIDRKYNISLTDITFDGWYRNSVHLWPKPTKQRTFFYCLKELLYRHLVFVLYCLTVISILFFSLKRIAQNNLAIHLQERLPAITPQILDSSPKVDLQISKFFISNEEFELRINVKCFQFWKIQVFAKFVIITIKLKKDN